MTDKQVTVTFQLPESLREKIKSVAAFEDRSESNMIRRLLAEALVEPTEDELETGGADQ